MAAENTAPTADQNEAGAQTHYGLWAVFRRDPHPAEPLPGAVAAVDAAASIDSLRAVYDVSGLRADADVLVWLTG
ncbi:MAG TPA: chlorite dismutase, partial [Microbacterium sp.]|nr:chlorite dismutase [Microbacterium sp.]